MSAGERMKRYRQRLRDGVLLVPVEVDNHLLERLVAAGLLLDKRANEPSEIARAIQAVAEFLPKP